MEKENKKQISFEKALLISWLAVFLIFMTAFTVQIYITRGQNEYVEIAILNEQYLDTFAVEGLADCHNCLVMNVTLTPSNKKRVYFFANEHKLREDLQNGDVVRIRWVETRQGWLIRGVSRSSSQ